jgi:hypothetical protein
MEEAEKQKILKEGAERFARDFTDVIVDLANEDDENMVK